MLEIRNLCKTYRSKGGVIGFYDRIKDGDGYEYGVYLSADDYAKVQYDDGWATETAKKPVDSMRSL